MMLAAFYVSLFPLLTLSIETENRSGAGVVWVLQCIIDYGVDNSVPDMLASTKNIAKFLVRQQNIRINSTSVSYPDNDQKHSDSTNWTGMVTWWQQNPVQLSDIWEKVKGPQCVKQELLLLVLRWIHEWPQNGGFGK